MTFYTAIQSWLTRIEIAAIIFFCGFIIAKLTGKILRRLLAEAEINRILETAGFKPISNTIGTIAEYIIYTATFFVILQQFGLTKLVVGIIVVIGFIIITVSLLLTIRDFIPNFIAGILLRKKIKQYLGKNIKVGMVKGKLKHFGIMASVIEDKDKHYVPHTYTSKQKIILSRAG